MRVGVTASDATTAGASARVTSARATSARATSAQGMSARATSAHALNVTHLATMTTPLGLFEHALLDQPRPEHGFCVDDVARALVVTAREPHPTPEVRRLTATYLHFILDAQVATGAFHNRRSSDGRWTDGAGIGDHWGRALWALGTAVADPGLDDAARSEALHAAELGLQLRSPWWRATAYAVLGAAAILRVDRRHVAALALLEDARAQLMPPAPAPRASDGWLWPHDRLEYADAVLPEALVAIGHATADPATLSGGMALLRWLVDVQTSAGHLSPTPAGGRGAGDPAWGFDQQPIEVTCLAEACWRAYGATGERWLLDTLGLCLGWFMGGNDTGATLYDESTGGGYDGLEASGVNQNQGAESTLAALATFQLCRIAAAADHS